MPYFPRRRAAAESHTTQALVDYVDVGLNLLSTEVPEKAYEHFVRSSNWSHKLNVGERIGQFRLVQRLLSEEDLVNTTTFLAGNSKVRPEKGKIGTVIIAGYSITRKTENAGTSKSGMVIDPMLAEQLSHEAALIAAEEWLHLVQEHTRQSLAGISLIEADVAAHLDNLGVPLSIDYVTRYPERATWYVQRYPERATEIQAFSNQYSYRYGPLPRFESQVAGANI